MRKYVWHSIDGGSDQVLLHLYLFSHLLSSSIFVFSRRHSRDGADYTIFILSLSFSLLISLSLSVLDPLKSQTRRINVKRFNIFSRTKKKGKMHRVLSLFRILFPILLNNSFVILIYKQYYRLDYYQ